MEGRDSQFEERERSAGAALDGYRERRRRRRAEDTYYGSVEGVLADAHALDAAEHHKRRSEIMEEARREEMPVELAEALYDVALDESLDPALAYELVRTGLGVIPPPEGVSNAAEQPVTDKYVPDWLAPAVPPDDLLRERMLRLSFRRLRRLLEEHGDLAESLREFAREPDVGYLGY